MERDIALPPEPKSAHVGMGDAALKERIGREGARTVPGRPEHGGQSELSVTNIHADTS